MKRILLTIALTAAVILGIGGLNAYFKDRPYIPEGFQDARAAGTQAAVEMNNLITSSLKTLSDVDTLDRRFAYASALALVSKEIQNANIRIEAAINLSRYMEEMASFVADIRPQEAKRFAFEAVSAQVAAVARLTAYNETLARLFDTLRNKFQGKPTNPATVIQLIEELNGHAREINSLNEKFQAYLAEFDSHYRP